MTFTSASAATAESTTVSTAASTASTAAAALARLGLVHLDLLAVEGGTVHLPDGGLGSVLVLEGDEGVTLSGVVDIGDRSKLLELALEK